MALPLLCPHVASIVVTEQASALLLEITPEQLEAVTSDPQTVRPQAQQIAVASASASVISPGSLRRFRGQDESKVTGIEGFFKQLFTPRAAQQPTQPRRPTPVANTRDDQGTDRIRRVWAIGVFR